MYFINLTFYCKQLLQKFPNFYSFSKLFQNLSASKYLNICQQNFCCSIIRLNVHSGFSQHAIESVTDVFPHVFSGCTVFFLLFLNLRSYKRRRIYNNSAASS